MSKKYPKPERCQSCKRTTYWRPDHKNCLECYKRLRKESENDRQKTGEITRTNSTETLPWLRWKV